MPACKHTLCVEVMDMTQGEVKTTWQEIEALVNAAGWILKWADCEGPLAHLSTADPAVAVMMSARRHCLRRARILREKVGA